MCKYRNCIETPPPSIRARVRLYCSVSCKRSEETFAARERQQIFVYELLGKECRRCGWHEHLTGLDAHHVDPSTKSFELNGGNTYSRARVIEEASKCVLLCANCHRVVHATKDPLWLAFPTSSMAERGPVKAEVEGSSPSLGAQ